MRYFHVHTSAITPNGTARWSLLPLDGDIGPSSSATHVIPENRQESHSTISNKITNKAHLKRFWLSHIKKSGEVKRIKKIKMFA